MKWSILLEHHECNTVAEYRVKVVLLEARDTDDICDNARCVQDSRDDELSRLAPAEFGNERDVADSDAGCGA